MVFNIEGIGYENRIIAGAYKINEKNITADVVDSMGRKHKRLKRKQIVGSVDMYFPTIEEFEEFTKIITENNYLVNIELTVNNIAEDVDSIFFVNYEPVRDINGLRKDYIQRYTLTVEEQ